jgi:hypothetical protein
MIDNPEGTSLSDPGAAPPKDEPPRQRDEDESISDQEPEEPEPRVEDEPENQQTG